MSALRRGHTSGPLALGLLGIHAFVAGCDLPPEPGELAPREDDQDPAPLEPPPSIPGSLADEKLPPLVDRVTDKDVTPDLIVDQAAAVRLGKALFWDMQAGSDGQACASCHFSAGADNRAKNQLSPGLLGGNGVFDDTRTGDGGPNYTLVPGDFPFHVKADPEDRDSEVLFDTDDVASSQGVRLAAFQAVDPGELDDDCAPLEDPLFRVDGIGLRRVEPRNTPTVINAAFNLRNFWDGRANRLFNGVDPFGRRNKKAFILEVVGGKLVQRKLELENASLASQAVGPTLSDFEMSCSGRRFADVGRKLLRAPTRPLDFQRVHPDDSVLGDLSAAPAPGLTTTYAALVQQAFAPKLWQSDQLFRADKSVIKNPLKVPESERFTQMEVNFSLFWGLAIQAYERTLISANTPFDRYRDGRDSTALGPVELAGLDVFMNQGKCVNCHGTAMFTKASTLHLLDEAEEGGLVERMLMSEEHLHYTLRSRPSVALNPAQQGKKSGATLRLAVSATPTFEAGAIVPGDAQGPLELVDAATKTTCRYDPATLTFGADGQPATRDVAVEADLIEGAGCPAHLRVRVVDDLRLGNAWRDLVAVDAGGGPLLFVALVDAPKLEVRQPALYDNGFYNIGARPTADDPGVGGEDPFGNPLSFTAQYVRTLLGKKVPDPFDVDPCRFAVPWNVGVDRVLFPGGFEHLTDCGGELSFLTGTPRDNDANERFIERLRTAVRGAFKTPTLRNVQLTAPFMHNGGMSTLEQVVEFYDRGGDFPRNDELDPDITRLELTPDDQAALTAFLRALTDPDVVDERAPFDHPEIFVPRGLPLVLDVDDDGHADENLFVDGLHVPAVGAAGRAAQGLPPIATFLGLEDDALP